jgi:hypothetical protein
LIVGPVAFIVTLSQSLISVWTVTAVGTAFSKQTRIIARYRLQLSSLKTESVNTLAM